MRTDGMWAWHGRELELNRKGGGTATTPGAGGMASGRPPPSISRRGLSTHMAHAKAHAHAHAAI